MPTELTFGAAILVGLLGSSHCIGMCGGIVAALNMGIDPGPAGARKPIIRYQLAYNGGRIISYVLVGLVAGALGAGLMALGIKPIAGKLLAAGFLVALGLYLANWWRGLVALERLGARLWRHIQPLGKRLLPIRNPLHAFLLGMLWGWLPCGLVYAAVAWSLTTADPYQGALLMLGFGLGTMPALLIAGNLFNYLRERMRAPLLRTTAGVLIIAFGIYSGVTGFIGQHHHHHQVTDSSPTTFLTVPGEDSTRVPAILRRVA